MSLQCMEGTAACTGPAQPGVNGPRTGRPELAAWAETSPGLKSPDKAFAPYFIGCYKLCGNILKSTLQFKNITLKRHQLAPCDDKQKFYFMRDLCLPSACETEGVLPFTHFPLSGARHLLGSDSYTKLIFASTSWQWVGAKQNTDGWFGAEPGRQ